MFGLEQLSIVKNLPSPDGEWEVIEQIGEGNYGEVYKARGIKTGEIAAVKVMEVALDKEEDIKAELNVFQNHAHHPNIVNFYGAFVKKNKLAGDHLWIVMEYCSYGSVTDLAKFMKEKGEKMPEDVIAYILREVLAGLCYLHSSCVLHRDVKGQNVLLTKTARIKLIDFGISAVVDAPSGKRRTAIGTPYWMAPEVIACESQLEYEYDARSDIWSLGITAIEIADSTPPLFGEHPMRALFKIPKHSPPTLQSPSQWSKSFNNFIRVCLMKDFERRPTAKELLTHNFVNHVPSDPRPIRRKLVSLMDSQQLEEPTGPLTDSSSSTIGRDTIERNVKALRTLDTVSDLASLEYINENIIVSQLWKRYQKQQIYTYVGDILISINPFQRLNIYGDKYSQLYCRAPRSHLPPHIFAVANSAYQSLLHEKRDQCCVVSGESGAGKTEASNILVQQFMKLGQSETRSLEEKILKINPLMESFGNARTVINNNSSRFGKYLELHFTAEGRVMGAHVSEYLLEKSRVISQARRERNFHIFYYMLAGLSTRKQLGRYRLRSGQHYRYLEHRGTHKGNIKQDALYSERFDQIEQAFYIFDFTKVEFGCILSILSAILNIGDIRIEGEAHPHVGEVSVVTNMSRINDVANLLQIRTDSFHQAITTSQVITYGEIIVKPNSPEKALDARDAIAKTLYGRLFSWIVNRINPALNYSGSTGELHIGILDIFGFENFRKNSFEQLCINVANEQLQFYFNQHVFAWEQEEYEREGINVTQVGYRDNRPLLDLLLSRPMGLLSLLDEESKFPRSTDHSLAAKFHGNFKSSSYYSRPKDGGPTFTIHHYAGSVLYETANFLEKNRDTLKPDMAKTLQKSANEVVQGLFVTPLSRTGSLSAATGGKMVLHKVPPSATPLFNRRAPHHRSGYIRRVHGHTPLSSSDTVTAKLSQTVSTYFINSLRELMSKMLLAKPHFVRCIRPNEMKSPDLFQPDKVLLQLRYTGVLETTRIRKEGFSHRISFDDFVQRYRVICFPLSQPTPSTVANCSLILEKAGLENWAMGKTKVFLKYYHSESLLKMLTHYDKLATALQSLVRGFRARRKARQMRKERNERAAVKIQAGVRCYLVRCRYLRLVAKRDAAAVIIQTAFRGWRLRSQYLNLLQRRQVAAIKIQSAVRGWLYHRKYEAQKRNVAKIQRYVRLWLARTRLRKLKAEAEERKKKAALYKRKESLRWHLQQQAQASVQKMADQQKRPDRETASALIIQRAYRKSIVGRKKRRARVLPMNLSKEQANPAHHQQIYKDQRERKALPQWPDRALLPSQVRQSQLLNQQTGSPRGRRTQEVLNQQPKLAHVLTQQTGYQSPRGHRTQVLNQQPKLNQEPRVLTQQTGYQSPRGHRTQVMDQQPKKPRVLTQQTGYLSPRGHRTQVLNQPSKLNQEPRVLAQHPPREQTSLMITFHQPEGGPTSISPEVPQLSSSHGSNASSIRKLFEEMSRRATEVRQGPRGVGVKFVGHQRVKARRLKTKPDSVIQRLLERFDPTPSNNLTVNN